MTWLVLVMSLPAASGTPRVRIWRALKALGCAVLRDGVYVLPDDDATQLAFERQAAEVVRAGGSAQWLRVHARDADQERAFRALFDRTAQYGALLQQLERARARARNSPALRRRLKQWRRAFEAIAAVDYLPGPARAQVQERLSELEIALTRASSAGEPSAVSTPIPVLDRAAFQGRRWATRARPWVDRVASAWLIRRFIDPKARFAWLKDPRACPRGALGFDFDGATFTHVGARVTFEVLLASFGLDGDRALARIGALVHYLDIGGIPVPEAAGFERLLRGIHARERNDDRIVAEAARVLDLMYAAYLAEDEPRQPTRKRRVVRKPPRG